MKKEIRNEKEPWPEYIYIPCLFITLQNFSSPSIYKSRFVPRPGHEAGRWKVRKLGTKRDMQMEGKGMFWSGMKSLKQGMFIDLWDVMTFSQMMKVL